MLTRHLRIRSLLFAATLTLATVLSTVATVLADSGGGPFPR